MKFTPKKVIKTIFTAFIVLLGLSVLTDGVAKVTMHIGVVSTILGIVFIALGLSILRLSMSFVIAIVGFSSKYDKAPKVRSELGPRPLFADLTSKDKMGVKFIGACTVAVTAWVVLMTYLAPMVMNDLSSESIRFLGVASFLLLIYIVYNDYLKD